MIGPGLLLVLVLVLGVLVLVLVLTEWLVGNGSIIGGGNTGIPNRREAFLVDSVLFQLSPSLPSPSPSPSPSLPSPL